MACVKAMIFMLWYFFYDMNERERKPVIPINVLTSIGLSILRSQLNFLIKGQGGKKKLQSKKMHVSVTQFSHTHSHIHLQQVSPVRSASVIKARLALTKPPHLQQ